MYQIEPRYVRLGGHTRSRRLVDVHHLAFLRRDDNRSILKRADGQTIANKCSRTTGILNKLKHILPASISLMLYNSLLLPQLNYCILAWGHNCKRLIKLQNKALRIISTVSANIMHTLTHYLKNIES